LTPSKRKSPNERRGFLRHIRFAKQKSRRASAVYAELWRMSKASDFFTILQKASPAWCFPSDYWNATQPSFPSFDSFSSGLFTILQKASPATDGLGK
jgi:hypothetical protein